MKIHQLELYNLASIEGPVTIDFTAEPLVNAGVFAITGATGSGKSTLLDAICLALYDQTPRYAKAKENSIKVADVEGETITQNDVRAILRDGSGEGYAKLTFEATDQKCYRANWLVTRARRKVNGKLQASKIVLENLTNGLVVGDKKSEVLPQIERLVGLNFDQFTRAVLLAQGDFTAFLKADQKDKASLLEKLTGTSIYSSISQKVHEQYKAEYQKWESLNQHLAYFDFKTEEELAALQEELNQNTEQEIALDKAIKNATPLFERYKEAEKLSAELGKWEQQKQELLDEKLRIADVAAQLAIYDTLAIHTATFRDYSRYRSELVSLPPKIAELEQAQSASNQQLTQLENAFKSAQLTLSQRKAQWDALQPELQQAIEVDKEVELHQQQGQKSQENWQTKSEEVNRLAASLTKQESELAVLAALLQHTKKELVNSHYLEVWLSEQARLQVEIPKWNEAQSHYQQITEAVEKSKGTLQHIETELGHWETSQAEIEQQLATAIDLENHWKTQRESLGEAVDLAPVQQQEIQLRSAKLWAEQHVQLEKELAELDREQLEINQLLLSEKERLDNWTAEVDKSKMVLDEALHMQRLTELAQSEQVEALRAVLEPNQPCVVCGSTSHPYANHALEKVNQAQQTRIAELTAAHDKAQNGANTAKIQVAVYTDRLAKMASRKQSVQGQLTELKSQRQTLELQLPELTTWSLEEINLVLAKNSQEFEALTERNGKIATVFTAWTNAEQQMRNWQTKRTEQLQAKSTLERQLAVEQLELKNLLSKQTQLADLIATSQAYFSSVPYLTDYLQKNSWEEMAQWLTAYRQLQTEALQREKQSEIQKHEVAIAQKELDLAKEELLALQQKRDEWLGVYQSAVAARKELLNGNSVSTTVAQWSQAIQSAEQNVQQVENQYRQLEQQVHAMQQQITTEKQAMQAVEEKERETKAALTQWLNEQDITWETAIVLWDIPQQEIQQRRKMCQDLEEKLARLSGQETVLREKQAEVATLLQNATPFTELQEQVTTWEEQRKAVIDAKQAVQFVLQQQTEQRIKQAEVYQESEAQRLRLEPWGRLEQLIGSADGTKFRKIAQEFTLDYLVEHANVHLQELNSRYTLLRIPDSLGLQVCDQEMGDEIRSVYSLSGGESFLVSLALALGLSSLTANRMHVDCLFIDEGFGTLDPDTLAVAVDVLERLQQQGKKVGIISHVAELTERITTQIRVEKSHNGKATIRVLGF